ncbi:hypothetical protein [Gymnodinialimonas sp.]
MTKTFSALVVVLAGLGSAAPAQVFPSLSQSLTDFLPLELPAFQSSDLPEPLEIATPPTWMYDLHGADPETIDLLVWAATRPETWGAASAPYQVAHPGPSYVGLIPAPVPDGWVVTHRCLAWDDTYVGAETPNGDCYIFEMRPFVAGPLRRP